MGAMGGIVVGAVAGMPAALLTFGLSIPICSAIGAVVGGGTGAAVGGTAGFVGGSAAGRYGSRRYPEVVGKIDEYKTYARAKVLDSVGYITARVSTALGRGAGTGETPP